VNKSNHQRCLQMQLLNWTKTWLGSCRAGRFRQMLSSCSYWRSERLNHIRSSTWHQEIVCTLREIWQIADWPGHNSRNETKFFRPRYISQPAGWDGLSWTSSFGNWLVVERRLHETFFFILVSAKKKKIRVRRGNHFLNSKALRPVWQSGPIFLTPTQLGEIAPP